MRSTLMLASLLLLCAIDAQAQLYKWIGPDGKISYSDTPPPPSATQVETKALAPRMTDTADFPFELAQATKNSPVTLYTTDNCAPCDDGRKLLAARGVPFTEKTVTTGEDASQFRKLAGANTRLPYLTIGRSIQHGFEPDSWNTALGAAGYPTSSRLPNNYHHPAPQALAPAPQPARQDKNHRATSAPPVPQATSGELPPAIGNAPPGFRF